MPPQTITPQHFIGRDPELRTLTNNIDHHHPTLVIGDEGIGKTALLEVVATLLSPERNIVTIERLTPFGTFLRDLYTALWEKCLLPEQTSDLTADLKTWGRGHPNNDAKARRLLAILDARPDTVIVIDDAAGVTPTNRPHLEQLVETITLIAAIHPTALAKRGTKRFWKRFDELRLGPLPRTESEHLLEQLIVRYGVQADEPDIYRRKVLDLAQGNPFELTRLVKYHSAEEVVTTKDLDTYGQSFVERDERGIVLAPLLLVAGAIGIALRYIARAQGDLDLYVLGGISIAVFIVLGPWLRHSFRPRSR
jgi:energy-coupling factor transporter ATP-binding protein EcfA2